jgi:hypothetical protein
MGRHFTRSKSLLAVVAMAVIAALCTAPAAAANPRASSPSTAPCAFTLDLKTCESIDQAVSYTSHATGDTSNCSFVFTITWGDGASSSKTVTDPSPGYHPIGSHVYGATGVYTISVNVQLTAGTCTATSSVHTFTLDSPPPPPSAPTPDFVCVTGPHGTCLGRGAGVSTPDDWAPTPPDWLTSPITGGCILELPWLWEEAGLEGVVDLGDFLEDLGTVVQYRQSSGDFFVLLRGSVVDSCGDLAYLVLTHQPIPQNLAQPDTLSAAIHAASAQKLLKSVPKSQLKSVNKLPFLRKQFGFAVAQMGTSAAVKLKYQTKWTKGTQQAASCRSMHGGYRCDWSFKSKKIHYSGYVLIKVTGSKYSFETLKQLTPRA